jgi:hypothetical protein
MIPAKSSIAAAALALMIKKGGVLRLRKSELAEVSDLVVTANINPSNSDIIHFGTVTQAEAAAAMTVLDQLLKPAEPAKEPDASK